MRPLSLAVPLTTLVDCADHPEFCGGIRELAQAMVAATIGTVHGRRSVSTSSDSHGRGHAHPVARGVAFGFLGIVGVFVHLRPRRERPDEPSE